MTPGPYVCSHMQQLKTGLSRLDCCPATWVHKSGSWHLRILSPPQSGLRLKEGSLTTAQQQLEKAAASRLLHSSPLLTGPGLSEHSPRAPQARRPICCSSCCCSKAEIKSATSARSTASEQLKRAQALCLCNRVEVFRVCFVSQQLPTPLIWVGFRACPARL